MRLSFGMMTKLIMIGIIIMMIQGMMITQIGSIGKMIIAGGMMIGVLIIKEMMIFGVLEIMIGIQMILTGMMIMDGDMMTLTMIGATMMMTGGVGDIYSII